MSRQILFDIGANEGKYTDANMKNFDKYILVEANPVLAEKLREKYRTNTSVYIVEAIASNKENEVFYISNANHISTSDPEWIQKSRFSNNYTWTPVEGIKTVSVDTLIQEFGEPTLIKIDVEGYEYNVLQSLSKKVNMLCFEWAEEKKKEILLSLEYLNAHNYTKFHIQIEDEYDYSVKDGDWQDYTTVYNTMNTSCDVNRKDSWGMIWAFQEIRRINSIMKFLYVDTYVHHKNRLGFILMCKARNIECVQSRLYDDFAKEWDLVFIPSEYIHPGQFPNAKTIMYGPQNFVFVNGNWSKNAPAFPPHCFYNLLSDWVIDAQNEFGGLSLATKSIPFAVDTELFKPRDSPKLYDCFVYFKQRHTDELKYVTSILDKKNLKYKVIVYGKYKEEDYIQTLHLSKFGIWIGRHESQGFAVEEALSCNVPLLVFDCTSMFQEYNENNEILYKNELGRYSLKGTVIPYWDDTCGIAFTKKEEFTLNLERMLTEYNKFQPRIYVEKALSPIACIDRLLKEITPT